LKQDKRNDKVTDDQNPIWPKTRRFQWWLNRDGYYIVDDPDWPESILLRKQIGRHGWRLTFDLNADDESIDLVFDEGESTLTQSGSPEQYPLRSAIIAKNFDFEQDVVEGDGRPTGCYDINVEEYPGLFRDFGDMPRTREGVLEFASRFGFLGVNTLAFRNPQGSFVGEWVADWVAESHKFHLLLRLWDEIQENKFHATMDRTERWAAYYDGGYSFIHYDFRIDETARSGCLSLEFELPYRNYRDTGSWLEEDSGEADIRRFDEYMREVSTNTFHNHLIEAIRSTCYPDFELKAGSHIRLQPSSLLGAMYLQFLNEVIGTPDPINKCPVCGIHFKAENSAKKFCSDACKMKSYRRAKKRLKQDA
jgi:predicted nucleic acid-binding Zn ribbon protein